MTAGDFTFTGGTITSVVQGADTQHYTVTVNNTATGDQVTDTLTYKAGQVFDQAGNANVAASATATGDTNPPAAPVITDVDSAGYYDSNYTSVVVSGHAEAGSTVTIYDTQQNDYGAYVVNGFYNQAPDTTAVVVGTGTADANGRFSVYLDNDMVSDETHVFTATATDKASNVSGNAASVAAAILSPGDTYLAATALNKNIAVLAPAIASAIGNGSAYFVVGSGDGSSDFVNAGRSTYQVINDEYSTNASITVGASQFSVVHGGAGATITAGSGQNVFVVDALFGFASTSPSSDPQLIHGFKASDSIDVSQLMTPGSTIEIDQTATGSVLIVHGGNGGLLAPTLMVNSPIGIGQDTVVNITGAHLTAGQVITAVNDPDYYNVTNVSSADTATLVTSVAVDGTRTEIASGNARDYAVALDGGAGFVARGSTVATVSGLSAATFADGTLYFDVNGLAAQVDRAHIAAFGTAASPNDLAVGVQFLAGGHTLVQLEDAYLATPALAGEASLTNQQFVDLSYQHAFGRTADAGGEAGFTNALNTGALTRASLLAEFAQSQEEHAHTDDLVRHGVWAQSDTTLVYEQLLGRNPTSSELTAGNASNLSGHDQGVQLGASQAFHDAVVNVEGSYSNATVVDYLYQTILHRHVDASGLNTFTTYLNNGAAPIDVAQALATSAEAGPSSIQQAGINGASFLAAPIHADEVLQAVFGTGTSDSRFAATVSDFQHGATLTGEADKYIQADATLSGDNTADFIAAIYHTALGRDVDASGAASWSDLIDHQGLSKAAFVTDIINSVEFQSHFDPNAAIVANANPAPIIP